MRNSQVVLVLARILGATAHGAVDDEAAQNGAPISDGTDGAPPRAPIVGDVYRVQIHDPESALPMVFARCLRSRFLREDAIDCAFAFFSALDAAEIISGSESSDLLD